MSEKKISELQNVCYDLQKTLKVQHVEVLDMLRLHDETKIQLAEMETRIERLNKLQCEKDGRIHELNRSIEKVNL